MTEWQPRVSIPSFHFGGRPQWPPVWAFNRLESVVLPHRPEVLALKHLLQEAGGAPVLMSGSGASVFALAAGRRHAEQVEEQIRREMGPWLWTRVAQVLPDGVMAAHGPLEARV